MSQTGEVPHHPYASARAVLREMHAIYLQKGNLLWSLSPQDGEFGEMCLSAEDAWKAMQLLVTLRLAKFRGSRAIVLTEAGIRVCDRGGFDDVLPLPGMARLAFARISVEGGFEEATLARQLGFLRDADLAAGLARDLQELRRALEAGLPKASLLLCGSVLEAVLLDVVGRRSDLAAGYRPKRKFPDGFALVDLIEIVVEEKIVPESVGKMAACVTEHRDLIHPAAERRKAAKVDSERSAAMVAFLKVIIKDLAEAHETGMIKAYEAR